MAKVALKSPEPQNDTETSNKPKRSKRKLFKTQISSPLDIASHPVSSAPVRSRNIGTLHKNILYAMRDILNYRMYGGGNV